MSIAKQFFSGKNKAFSKGLVETDELGTNSLGNLKEDLIASEQMVSKMSTESNNFVKGKSGPEPPSMNYGLFDVEVKTAHQKLYRWGDEIVVLSVKKKQNLIDNLEI